MTLFQTLAAMTAVLALATAVAAQPVLTCAAGAVCQRSAVTAPTVAPAAPTIVASPAANPDACHATTFHTQMIGQVCTGPNASQLAAKEAMKAFQKDHHITSCNECHSKLSPNYELKDDGLDTYFRDGGR
jgi:hypothetical protein